ISNLNNTDLDSIYGFIEAYVECPDSIERPFLPYRKNKETGLLFPTGKWNGVYYSEEGYLFHKTESPFVGYVSSLFNNRLLAKKDGNNAMSFVSGTISY
ncbi:DNA polymerase, partial [Bienertia sinuspersici]